jgi:hypothetical protein
MIKLPAMAIKEITRFIGVILDPEKTINEFISINNDDRIQIQDISEMAIQKTILDCANSGLNAYRQKQPMGYAETRSLEEVSDYLARANKGIVPSPQTSAEDVEAASVIQEIVNDNPNLIQLLPEENIPLSLEESNSDKLSQLRFATAAWAKIFHNVVDGKISPEDQVLPLAQEIVGCLTNYYDGQLSQVVRK